MKKQFKKLTERFLNWFFWSETFYDFYDFGEVVSMKHGFLDISATFTNVNKPKEYYIEKIKQVYERKEDLEAIARGESNP